MCARRCCSDILMDSNAFEANDPDVDVGANEVDRFAKLEDIFKMRQLRIFFLFNTIGSCHWYA